MEDRQKTTKCAVCGRGEGVHETIHGRLVCNRCLTSSKADDVVELRRYMESRKRPTRRKR